MIDAAVARKVGCLERRPKPVDLSGGTFVERRLAVGAFAVKQFAQCYAGLPSDLGSFGKIRLLPPTILALEREQIPNARLHPRDKAGVER
jgi:hypothetical protein